MLLIVRSGSTLNGHDIAWDRHTRGFRISDRARRQTESEWVCFSEMRAIRTPTATGPRLGPRGRRSGVCPGYPSCAGGTRRRFLLSAAAIYLKLTLHNVQDSHTWNVVPILLEDWSGREDWDSTHRVSDQLGESQRARRPAARRNPRQGKAIPSGWGTHAQSAQ